MFSLPPNIYSFFFLALLFCTIGVQAVYMILFEGVFSYALPAAFAICLGATAFLLRNAKQFFTFILSIGGVGLLFWLISLPYPDFSYDGPWYHQPIANSLVDGINVFKASTHSYWGDAYPKAIEIFGGEMLRNFPQANGYMVLNLLLATGLFFYIRHFSNIMNMQKKNTYIFAFFAVFSYVFVQLAYAHYVDYALYVMMLYSMLSLLLIIQKKNNALDTATFIMSNALAISIKMSGGLYPFVAFILLFGYGWYYSKNLLATVKKCFILGLPIAVLGVFVLGYNPYMTNILAGKHILHPLAGAEADPIVNNEQPTSFHHMNRFEKLAISLTSQSSNKKEQHTEVIAKYNPLSVSSAEIFALMGTGTRVGGWGPLFLAIILCTAVLPYFFRVNTAVFYPTALFLLLATFIHPESWWARYGFHVYVLPLALIFCLEDKRAGEMILRAKLAPFFLRGAVGLFSINVLIFCFAQLFLLLDHDARYARIFKEYSAGDIAICLPPYDYKYSFHPKQLFTFYGASLAHVNDDRCTTASQKHNTWYFTYTQAQ